MLVTYGLIKDVQLSVATPSGSVFDKIIINCIYWIWIQGWKPEWAIILTSLSLLSSSDRPQLNFIYREAGAQCVPRQEMHIGAGVRQSCLMCGPERSISSPLVASSWLFAVGKKLRSLRNIYGQSTGRSPWWTVQQRCPIKFESQCVWRCTCLTKNPDPLLSCLCLGNN